MLRAVLVLAADDGAICPNEEDALDIRSTGVGAKSIWALELDQSPDQ